jgi:hypothetical protein
MRKLLLFFLVLYIVPETSWQGNVRGADHYYFYRGRNFGSEALYNPFNLVVNGGYGIMQMEWRSREFLHLPYREGFRNVWRNISSPFGPISRYGWDNFATNELFPLHIAKTHAQWLPNYQLHLIGGGMSYRATYEWYDLHRFPAPRPMALTTIAAYHYLNEVVENGAYQGDNVDPIADLLFFDIGGIILFSFDNVNRFFSEKVVMADWSLMPSLAPRDMTIQNNGQNFSFKWKLPFSRKLSFFHYYGLQGLTGASYQMPHGRAFSIGIGVRAKELVIVDQETRRQTVSLVWNGGLFYDRDNSLLCSLLLSGQADKVLIFNAYPGLLRIGRFSPGLWLIMNQQGHPTIGAITSWVPGLALK